MRSSYLDIGACTSNDGASPESSRRKLPCLQGLSTPIIVGTVPYLISFAPPYRSHLISFAPSYRPYQVVYSIIITHILCVLTVLPSSEIHNIMHRDFNVNSQPSYV